MYQQIRKYCEHPKGYGFPGGSSGTTLKLQQDTLSHKINIFTPKTSQKKIYRNVCLFVGPAYWPCPGSGPKLNTNLSRNKNG